MERFIDLSKPVGKKRIFFGKAGNFRNFEASKVCVIVVDKIRRAFRASSS